MAGNQGGGLGDFLRQLNDIAKDVGQALNQASEVQRNPRPATAAGSSQRRKVEASRQSQMEAENHPASETARLAGDVRRNLGQTQQEREEQLRQHRLAHAKEQRAKQQKKEAFEKLQAQHRQEQQKIEADRRKKKAGGAPGASALRYAKFLKGKQRNVQDAVMLAEIIGPCRAEKGWRSF